MTLTEFRLLFAGSCLVVLLLLLQIIFSNRAQHEQTLAVRAQQVVTDGRNADLRYRQLATRVYQLCQQTQDQGLKDLLTRQQLPVPPPASSGAAPPAPTR